MSDLKSSGARIIPKPRPYTAPTSPIADALAMAGLVAGMMVLMGAGAAFAAMPRMSAQPGDANCIGYIAVENRAGWYDQVETVSTEWGEVRIRYETNGGHNATDHDEIEVVSLPLGVFARPMEAEIPDGDTFRVCLFEFVGG